MTNKFLKGAFAIAATASVAVLAGCPGGQTPGTTPTPGASPTAGASAAPGTPASPGATAAPTALPSTSDTSDFATVKGLIEDDQNQPLDGVTVKATILDGGQSSFSNGSKELTVTSTLGSYVLNGAPTGVTLKIVASKDGYTTRTQTYVPLANKQGDPSANQVNFGDGADDNSGSKIYWLSDNPEITSMTPARGATGVAQDASLVFTFSEPVDKDDFQDSFQVGLAKTETTFSSGTVVKQFYDSSKDLADKAPGDSITAANALYNKTHFTFTWNSDRTQVTAALKSGYLWPSDKDSGTVPSWAVSLTGKDAVLTDDANNQRSEDWFRLTETSQGKDATYFKVVKDDVDPEIESVQALNASGGAQDRILVKFSETMAIFTLAGAVNGTSNTFPKDNHAGYVLKGQAGGGNTLFKYLKHATNDAEDSGALFVDDDDLSDGDGEGKIYFDSNDASHKTVVLEFDTDKFAPGERVSVSVDDALIDPAGNTIPTDKDQDDTTV